MGWYIAMKSKFSSNQGEYVYFSQEYGWKKKSDIQLATSFKSKEQATQYAKSKFRRFKDWFIIEDNQDNFENIAYNSYTKKDGTFVSEIII